MHVSSQIIIRLALDQHLIIIDMQNNTEYSIFWLIMYSYNRYHEHETEKNRIYGEKKVKLIVNASG